MACKGPRKGAGRAPLPTCCVEAQAAAHPAPDLLPAQAARGDQQGHDAFYALLYVGLWHEAHADAEAAEAAITRVGGWVLQLPGLQLLDAAAAGCCGLWMLQLLVTLD